VRGSTVHDKIPGASHTYSKGDDQYPVTAPKTIARGAGCRVFDEADRGFIDWTMGLASVSLGHAYAPVVEAAAAWLQRGANFARPTRLEEELADALLAIVPCAGMVKFGKHGSDGTSSAVRLARAFTGRDRVIACGSNPFYSQADWWIGTTEVSSGIPSAISALTLLFPFGDLDALDRLLDQHGRETACVIVEPAATTPYARQGICPRCAPPGAASCADCPQQAFWHEVQRRVRAAGALFILDENKTGFRLDVPGGETFFNLQPDMVCYGKAISNGFSVSALAGRSDVLDQGGILQRDRDRVFLLSATHGGETHALAAALRTVQIMRDEPVIAHIWQIGRALVDGFNALARELGVHDHFALRGYPCFPAVVIESGGRPDHVLRTLFLQEMAARGVLFNFIAPSYSHDAAAVAETLAAAEGSLAVCGEALAAGDADRRLLGPVLRPVFRRRN
jgi:glutamate-1-semialdehyde 2,1-aminomutase